MPQILRIEDVDGVGMYYSEHSPSCLDGTSCDRHPMPWQDTKLSLQGISSWDIDKKWRFGFSSLDQARSWLYNDTELKKLQRAGFRLVIYTVLKEHCKIGNSQVMYDEDHAEILGCYDICDYFNVV